MKRIGNFIFGLSIGACLWLPSLYLSSHAPLALEESIGKEAVKGFACLAVGLVGLVATNAWYSRKLN